MAEIGIEALAALAAVAFVAGFVDSIAGGGGLLTVPALLIAGLSPAEAIATNKVQGVAAAASATWTFGRRGLIAWRKAAPFALVALAGGIAGALCVSLAPRAFLEALVPVLLISIALFFALFPRIGNAEAAARIGPGLFAATAPLCIGFYDGAFGPGAGSFYMLAFVLLLGYGVVKATAHTKLVNLASNCGGLLLFAATGAVNWAVGLTLAAGALAGAQIGARLALRFGANLIRPLLVVVSCAMALRLLLEPGNPWRLWLGMLF